MKKLILLLTVFAFSLPLTAQEIHPRNLLSGDLTEAEVAELLIDDWRHFPTYKDRAAWRNLPVVLQKEITARGNEALKYEWPTLPATLYLEFSRNGNRSNYQDVYFERRRKLLDLVIAETLNQTGAYLDQIINGVWAICEESSWCIPAHISLQRDGRTPLPRPDEHVVDLFAAETGATMAWTYYLLKDQLAEVTPVITERIEMEMDKRILSPYLEREDFWWMGLGERKDVNNWNPWVISNWLVSALLMEKDPDRKAKSIYKAMACLDNFINIYPEDGGCDEGPGYWGRAGASLFDCLDWLHSASEGRIDIYDEPLIKNIGAYIKKAYISHPYYINFADASAKTTPSPDIVYRFGRAIDDREMMAFAGFLLREDGDSYRSTYSFGRQLNALFSYEELSAVNPAEPLPRDVWLPDLEVYAARSSEGTDRGIYLAGKGGHNDESHNHNDVGNYIVYYNGRPVLIDVGVETYSRKTFSSERYDIWTMQSQYHTLPTINGQMQSPGRNFRSSDMQYEMTDEGISVHLDIAGAYPEEAGVRKWERTIDFIRGESVQVLEEYRLDEVKGETALYFVTPCKPDIRIPGTVRLQDPSSAFTMFMLYPEKQFEVSMEPIQIDDQRLLSVWGEQIYRVKFKVAKPRKRGMLRYTIEALN